MGIGVGIFLMVLGAILAFAVETDVPGINVNSLGVILLLIGLVAVVYSLLFWSSVTPWGRRRVVARPRLAPPGGPPPPAWSPRARRSRSSGSRRRPSTTVPLLPGAPSRAASRKRSTG